MTLPGGRHMGQGDASFLFLKLSGEYTGLLIFKNMVKYTHKNVLS